MLPTAVFSPKLDCSDTIETIEGLKNLFNTVSQGKMANPKGELLPGAVRVGGSTVVTELARHQHSSSHYLAASDSQPATMVTRMRSVKWLVTDGPFAETHELLGG